MKAGNELIKHVELGCEFCGCLMVLRDENLMNRDEEIKSCIIYDQGDAGTWKRLLLFSWNFVTCDNVMQRLNGR